MNEYFLKIPKKEAHPSIQESTNHRPWLIELASCSIEQSNIVCAFFSIYFTFVIENLHNFALNFIPLFLCYICIINGKF